MTGAQPTCPVDDTGTPLESNQPTGNYSKRVTNEACAALVIVLSGAVTGPPAPWSHTERHDTPVSCLPLPNKPTGHGGTHRPPVRGGPVLAAPVLPGWRCTGITCTSTPDVGDALALLQEDRY